MRTLTESEVKLALECCISEDADSCYRCPFYKQCEDGGQIASRALNLINEKDVVIEELTLRLNATIAAQETLQKALAEKNAQIEKLKAENELQSL